jgi:hypothetical protein
VLSSLKISFTTQELFAYSPFLWLLEIKTYFLHRINILVLFVMKIGYTLQASEISLGVVLYLRLKDI